MATAKKKAGSYGSGGGAFKDEDSDEDSDVDAGDENLMSAGGFATPYE